MQQRWFHYRADRLGASAANPGGDMIASTRHRNSIGAIVIFLARLWFAWVLLQISSGASWLARKAVPAV